MPFWSKDEQVRIDETFDYIAGKVPADERLVVKSFLKNWLAATYGGGAIGQRAFSEALSTRHASNTGDKETRAGRRALVILRGDMLNGSHPLKMMAAQIMSMPSVQVAGAVNAMLPGFRLYAQQEERVNTMLQTKLTALSTNPETFLRDNLVVTQSSPSGTGVGKAEDHRFIFHYGDQVFLLVPSEMRKPNGVRGEGLTIKAVNVPEMFWFNVPGRGNLPAPGSFATIPCTELKDADLMVTSAFTGCSFCFKENGGTVYAAHISPDGTAANAGPNIGAAPALATQIGGLGGTGNFNAPVGAQAGALKVFGRGYSNVADVPGGYTVNALPGQLTASSMYVFGVRNSGTWNIVFQENNAGTRTTGRLL